MTIKEVTSKRSIWMAFGILWVVFFHTDLVFNIVFLDDFKFYGNGGVDILIFASGLGCFYSFSKDENIPSFLVRRIKRLLPLFICFVLITHFKEIFTSKPDVFLCYLFSSKFNWFMKAIWIMYLLVPVFYAFIKKNDGIAGKILLIPVIMVVSCASWDNYPAMVILCRIPVFVLGMIVGWLSTNEKVNSIKIPALAYIVTYVIMILGFVWLKTYYSFIDEVTHRIALKWWPYILTSPGICLTLSFISLQLDKIKVGKILNACANTIGKSTFEIYMWHIFLNDRVKRYEWLGGYKKWIPWFLEVTVICALTILIEKLVKVIISKIKERIKRKREQQ